MVFKEICRAKLTFTAAQWPDKAGAAKAAPHH
jgi:hypothetical protein